MHDCKRKSGKIVLVTLCIQIEWLFCNVGLVSVCPTVFISRRLGNYSAIYNLVMCVILTERFSSSLVRTLTRGHA